MGSKALPWNPYLEALPRLVKWKMEAEPPDIRYQAEPGNKYKYKISAPKQPSVLSFVRHASQSQSPTATTKVIIL